MKTFKLLYNYFMYLNYKRLFYKLHKQLIEHNDYKGKEQLEFYRIHKHNIEVLEGCHELLEKAKFHLKRCE